MKKIVLSLIFGIVSLYAGTLRILNIPVNSTIEVDGKKYYNTTKRSLEITLDDKLFSGTYSLKVTNKYFLPYTEQVEVSKTKATVVTLKMQYTKKFFTNIFVEDVDGKLDSCKLFSCSVSGDGKKLANNLYQFTQTPDDQVVDFTVKRKGYYDETDSYDANKNQQITISPVSSWGLFGIGGVGALYPADEDLILTSEDGEFMPYYLEDTPIGGWNIFYKKNTIFNIYFGVQYGYMTNTETQGEADEDLTDNKNYNGVPSIEVTYVGGFVGYRYHRAFFELGANSEDIDIEKTYTDKMFIYQESRVNPYFSFEYLFWKVGQGGMTIGVSTSSEKISKISLTIVF